LTYQQVLEQLFSHKNNLVSGDSQARKACGHFDGGINFIAVAIFHVHAMREVFAALDGL